MRLRILNTGDRATDLRLKRQLMGLFTYLMFVIPLLYAVGQGWTRFGYRGLALISLVAVAINLGFWMLIRTGFSTRFRDPTLVVPQILVAVMLALVIAYGMQKARGVVLMLFFTAFFFGVFNLTTRQYLAMTALTALGYALVLALKFPAPLRDSEAFRLELLNFMVLVVVLSWLSLLGGYIARLRLSLSRKREALATALMRLQTLASHDELTGVYNRRHLMDMLHQQHERARRHGEGFSICILDLDHFKLINDAHGHGVGDETLQAFAEQARLQARRMDALGRASIDSTFGRYGGEEFLVVLPYTDMAGAAIFAERLRKALRACPPSTSAGPLPLTFSAGIAQYRNEESIQSLINRADAALYLAKQSGRDQAMLATGD